MPALRTLPAAVALALALALALLARAAHALTLSGGGLTVELDDLFPRPLSYALAATGEGFAGAMVGAGFHLAVSVNAGQASCGEAGVSTDYAPAGAGAAAFSVALACALNWPDGAGAAAPPLPPLPPGARARVRGAPPPVVFLELNGTVAVEADAAAGGGAAVLRWALASAAVLAGSAPGMAAISSLDIAGFELATLRPVPAANTSQCFYMPDDAGKAPACGGEHYYVDAWGQTALDEWQTGTFSSLTIAGEVEVNTAPGGQLSCVDGAASRLAPGPYASNIAAGWSHAGLTGIAAVSSQHHTPFYTGPRAHDVPGRCSVFTLAPARIYTSFPCGSALPYTLTVGVFPDLTQTGGAVDGDDVAFWRRHQYARADVLYRTTLPYKLGLDYTAYVPQSAWGRITFAQALDYAANMSAIFDAYAQTPILVGWQGLGHDTLYPALDVVNARCGGAAALAAYDAGLRALNAASSTSYHVNSDEAYSLFAGAPNPEFDIGICRLNVDHATPWYSNCSVTHEQTPDCGLRCSISKTRDAASHGRAARMSRLLAVVPPGLRTVHSDAWRDVGASWERDGYIPCESEAFCGQQGDARLWSSHGASLGCEGENGQALDTLGIIDFYYHGDGYDIALWGRIVCGSSLGFDTDVYCYAPGGKCARGEIADAFYLQARLYQLALTDELLGNGTDAGAGGAPTHHRFLRGGRIQHAHAAPRRRADAGADAGAAAPAGGAYSPPSTWPYGGDSIPVARTGAVFVPLVQPDGELAPYVAHAYITSGAQPQPFNASCPLFSTDPAVYAQANNTCIGDWNVPTTAFDLDPAQPEAAAVAQCRAACAGNATCDGWDMIKVTPSSGKVKPLCMLFVAPQGCCADANQWAGVKAPLPRPGPDPGMQQVWTLPLSWVGRTLTATTATDDGPVQGLSSLSVNGRVLTIGNMTPGVAVRISAA